MCIQTEVVIPRGSEKPGRTRIGRKDGSEVFGVAHSYHVLFAQYEGHSYLGHESDTPPGSMAQEGVFEAEEINFEVV